MSNKFIRLIADFGKAGNATAWGKARADVDKTLSDVGYEAEELCYKKFTFPFTSKKVPVVSAAILASQIPFLKVNYGETFIVQYPFPLSCIEQLIRKIHSRGGQIVFLIHDINSLRWGKVNRKEVVWMNSADHLIVHSEAMASALKNMGVTTKMNVIHLFDYYSKDAMPEIEETLTRKGVVAFAGNLEKSKFLEPLMGQAFSNINVELYGLKGTRNLDGNDHIHYQGVFNADHTGAVKAGWGLVWDGDRLDTCSGILGNYLKVNASHKLSLYLACGMPVIVWKESALASWLTVHHVAIAVSSLKDIESTISGITDAEYKDMVVAARELGNHLRRGGLLKEQLINIQSGNNAI